MENTIGMVSRNRCFEINNLVSIVLSKIPNYGSLIISSGVVVSIKEVVEEIIESVGFTGPVRWKATAEIGQENKIPKNEKLMSLLPDLAFTDLRTGIKKTVEWHIEAHKSQLST